MKFSIFWLKQSIRFVGIAFNEFWRWFRKFWFPFQYFFSEFEWIDLGLLSKILRPVRQNCFLWYKRSSWDFFWKGYRWMFSLLIERFQDFRWQPSSFPVKFAFCVSVGTFWESKFLKKIWLSNRFRKLSEKFTDFLQKIFLRFVKVAIFQSIGIFVILNTHFFKIIFRIWWIFFRNIPEKKFGSFTSELNTSRKPIFFSTKVKSRNFFPIFRWRNLWTFIQKKIRHLYQIWVLGICTIFSKEYTFCGEQNVMACLISKIQQEFFDRWQIFYVRVSKFEFYLSRGNIWWKTYFFRTK